MSLLDSQTRAICSARQFCDILRSNVAIIERDLYTIGLKNSRHFFIEETKRDSFAHVFPRFASATCTSCLDWPRPLSLARVITLVLVSRHYFYFIIISFNFEFVVTFQSSLRGEKLNYKSVAKEI